MHNKMKLKQQNGFLQKCRDPASFVTTIFSVFCFFFFYLQAATSIEFNTSFTQDMCVNTWMSVLAVNDQNQVFPR